MSLCSCSSCLTSSSTSSMKWSESSNSYRLLSSSSITTVSSQPDHQRRERNLTTDDDEQWPAPPVEATQNWQIEKNISLKNQQSNKTSCILKAIMTKGQIVLSDSSTTRSTIIPGKRISMKVVFHL